MKTALLAEGLLDKDDDGKIPQSRIAAIDKRRLINTLDEFFANLQQAGFLMLNATPVLHPGRKPVLEARYWQAFLEPLLFSIAQQADAKITLLLWGKIAQQVEAMPVSQHYDKLVCEHPYNLSFIDNPQMLRLFADLSPLQQRKTPAPPIVSATVDSGSEDSFSGSSWDWFSFSIILATLLRRRVSGPCTAPCTACSRSAAPRSMTTDISTTGKSV